MRSESLRSFAVAILTVQFVLTGTLAALDDARLSVLQAVEDSYTAMLNQSSWRMFQTLTAESTAEDPMPSSTVTNITINQIVSARPEPSDDFDLYARRVEVSNREGSGERRSTIEVSSVGVEDLDVADDQWVRISSVSPAELVADIGIPEGEWSRVGSVGEKFRGSVVALLGSNSIGDFLRKGGGRRFDDFIIDAAEERERETINGVETRVFFVRRLLTKSSVAGLVTAGGIDTTGLLEATIEDVDWLDADSMVAVKQESTSNVKREGSTHVLSGTTQFSDYNMPLQVPDSTSTFDEATDAIAG